MQNTPEQVWVLDTQGLIRHGRSSQTCISVFGYSVKPGCAFQVVPRLNFTGAKVVAAGCHAQDKAKQHQNQEFTQSTKAIIENMSKLCLVANELEISLGACGLVFGGVAADSNSCFRTNLKSQWSFTTQSQLQNGDGLCIATVPSSLALQ